MEAQNKRFPTVSQEKEKREIESKSDEFKLRKKRNNLKALTEIFNSMCGAIHR